jgi:conjugative transposon TraN protein
MKQLITVLVTGVFLLLSHPAAFSQRISGADKTAIIEPYPLWVTLNKTTNLIFPYAIKSVDRGSRDVLTQKAKGVENILLVKAGRENFSETNLSVITADGRLYSFLLNYAKSPSLLNISFPKDAAPERASLLLEGGNKEAEWEGTAKKIAEEKRMFNRIKDRKYQMRLRLNGLYIRSDVLYFQLEVRNSSPIGYDIDMLRFFIRDEKKTRRTASQEIELQPLYVYGDTSAVKEQQKSIFVMALPKFTIPDQKYLLIQLMERNGGRHLSINVRNRTLVKARGMN